MTRSPLWPVPLLIALSLSACEAHGPALTEVLNHNLCRTLQPGARLVQVHELPNIRGVRLLTPPTEQADGMPETDADALLVATSKGPQGSAGYALTLLGGVQEAERVILDYAWQTPPPDSAQALMLTSPCSVVWVKATASISEIEVRIDKETHALVAVER